MHSEPGTIIRLWRKMRELNQRDAAALAGISTRHQSFIENGHAKATAPTLKAIATALHMPEGDKNKLLLAAGYAPEQPLREVTDDELERAGDVFAIELNQCSDTPAFVADELWNLTANNDAFAELIESLEEAAGLSGSGHRNFAHLVFHPDGLRRLIVNWHVFSAFFMLTLRAESFDKPANDAFHKLINDVHPWSEDQNGADIVEPFSQSAIALPGKIVTPKGNTQSYLFSTYRFAAPSSSPVSRMRIGKFYLTD